MAQSRSPSPFPTTEMKKKQKQEDEQAVASLPEGPLVEILSRVPYRSLCRFKCVSKPWFALCSDPDIRKRCPQTLTGFFYNMRGFYNLSGTGPPMVDPFLRFLRKSYESVIIEHCCGGLVLCRCRKSRDSDEGNLVVCNPATENWIQLPPCPIESPYEVEEYLGFDPAPPSHFVVLVVQLVEFGEVAIYSSGRWTTVQSGWVNQPVPVGPSNSVFLNDTMHLMTHEPSIFTVDTQGKVWREIDIPGDVPQSCAGYSIGQSQGRLYAWFIDDPNVCQLSVWALEDYGSAKWTLKHTANILELFGNHCRKDGEVYEMFAVHPDRNLIFLTDGKKKTISYDMDNREVHVICTSKNLWDIQPYIPCFAEWLSDSH
ncbi:F-box protein At5g07610 [Lolium perenne]|uniref:F-box protein At5g07610 n=1 Tax=Lolium perenne TaxID=4522 RepID=UPI0021EAC3EA|nr:F-box protein At5g07610-like [Lolium perenne]